MKIPSLYRTAIVLAGCAAIAGLNGCAAVDQKIGLTYARQDHSLVRHSGDITVTRIEPASAAKNSFGDWIIGSLNNVHGVHQADLLSDRSPGEWITEAMLHELRQAGYTVNYAYSFPPAVPRGITITNINVFLTVNRGAVSADASHEIRFNVDVILNGDRAKTFTIASRDERTVPFDVSRDEKERILLQSLQDAMQQIMPEIITLIDKK